MTIYNINLAVGRASSGVEYAQLYRAELLRDTSYDAKFVFLELIQAENIQTYTSNLGLLDSEVMTPYHYFTGTKIAKTTYTIDQIVNSLGNKVVKIERHETIVKIILNGTDNFIRCYLSQNNRETIDRAEYVLDNMLIRKDFYTYIRTYSEYYAPKDNKAKLYMREFYHEDGSVAFEEHIEDNQHTYFMKDAVLYSWHEFVAYFIKSLHLTKNDIVIIDRAKTTGQAVLMNKGPAKVGIVIHAEHYSENATNDDYILWNNFYEYTLMNSDEIDFMITATQRQKELLESQMKKYHNMEPKIYAIPVGSLKELKVPEQRKPYSIITASRLADEKHIDWLIQAVVKAKQQVSELTFDIYGEGGKRKDLEHLITELQANHYIQLKGHVQLEKVYQNYELFLAGSTSEGFGLTLLEAVGSGLGMIGFDVNYGNTTFINEQNGFRIPINVNSHATDQYINDLADAIIKYFNSEHEFHQGSYAIAEQFTSNNVRTLWTELLNEVIS